MKLLAFDTSTTCAAVALCDGEDVLADIVVRVGTRHSEQLISMIEGALKSVGWSFSQLDAIAVGVGPGLFTGLRVGVATAQGLAFAHGCPLLGVCSLDAQAHCAPQGPGLIAVSKDARKKECYVGLYRRREPVSTGSMRLTGGLEVLTPPRLLTAEVFGRELNAYEEPILLMGDGAFLAKDVYGELLGRRAVWPIHYGRHLRASALAALALEQWRSGERPQPWEIQPIYIRPSEAEMNIGPPEGGAPLAGRVLPDGSVLPEPLPAEARDDGDLSK